MIIFFIIIISLQLFFIYLMIRATWQHRRFMRACADYERWFKQAWADDTSFDEQIAVCNEDAKRIEQLRLMVR